MVEMNIGLVLNPNSGKRDVFRDLLSSVSSHIKNEKLYCTESTFTHVKDYLKPEVVGSKVVTNTFKDTETAGRDLSEMDLIISFGGDGTISDLICGMRKVRKMVPIVGVALGTANCGPFTIIRTQDDLARFDTSKLTSKWVRGLDVFEDDRYCGTAFNDVVISDTLVSTVNNEISTVDARRFFHIGERVTKYPGDIGQDNSNVTMNAEIIRVDGRISQIVLSPFSDRDNEFYSFRAVNGLFCKIPYCGCNYGMIVSSEPIICIDDSGKAYQTELKQAIFSNDDLIEISGFEAFCILDGNPRVDLRQSSGIRIKPNEHAGLRVEVDD